MSEASSFRNRIREQREGRQWSQDELARRSGLSRAGISAIETGRLVPSTAAALMLAAALDCRVEDLFALRSSSPSRAEWAWRDGRGSSRCWVAEVGGAVRLYPAELTAMGMLPHDGNGGVDDHAGPGGPDPRQALVMAGCDPAVGLLAAVLARVAPIRLLPFQRSSAAALGLLQQGLVHVAGIHLGRAGAAGGNAAIVRDRLGPGYSLLRVGRWEEGVATDPRLKLGSVAAAVAARVRWVGREAGSGARDCLDEIFAGRPAPRHLARDHRGVAEAIRGGWAGAGVCLRLAGDEQGLDFLPVRQEDYDLCFPTGWGDDPRLRALVEAVRSPAYRRALADLPGLDATDAGAIVRVE